MAEEEGSTATVSTTNSSNNGGGDNLGKNNNNGGNGNGNGVNNDVEAQIMKNKMAIQKRFWDMVANDDDSEGSVEGSIKNEGNEDEEEGKKRHKKPSSNTSSPIPTSESSRKLARRVLHELEDWEDEHFDNNEEDTNKRKNLPFVFNRNSRNANLNDSFNIHDTEDLGSFVNDSHSNNDDEGEGLISERTEEKVYNTIERWSKIVTVTLVCVLILVFSIDAIIGAVNEEKILEIKKEEEEKNEKETTALSPTPTTQTQVPPEVPEAPSLPPTVVSTTTTTNQPSISTSTPTGIPSTHPLDVIVVTNPPSTVPPPPATTNTTTTSPPTITPQGNDIVPTTTTTSPPTATTTAANTNSTSSVIIRETLIGMLEQFFPSNKIPPTTSVQEDALDWLIVDYVESSGVIYLPGSTDVDNSYRVLERFVLAILYYESSGDTLWTDSNNNNKQDLWMSSESVCNWKDITCNNNDNDDPTNTNNAFIEKIELVQIGVRGTIPWELSTLNKLSILSLKANSLTGQIPTEFGNFGNNNNGNLQHISLGTNSLTGSIPTELFDMTALTFLQLSYNHLTGVIPTDLAKLSALSYLNLVHNNLSGSIPAELNLLLESIPFCQLGQGNPNLDGVPENCQV